MGAVQKEGKSIFFNGSVCSKLTTTVEKRPDRPAARLLLALRGLGRENTRKEGNFKSLNASFCSLTEVYAQNSRFKIPVLAPLFLLAGKIENWFRRSIQHHRCSEKSWKLTVFQCEQRGVVD